MTHTLDPNGTITSPGGFRVTGLHTGLKTSRDRDLGLVLSRHSCTAAAHFGASSGAAGAWSTARLRQHAKAIQGIVILSGMTGGRGSTAIAACDEVAALFADETGLKPEQVVLVAAGVDADFPLERLRSGIPRAIDELDSSAGRRLAAALTLTTETPQAAAVQVEIDPTHRALIGGLWVGERLMLTSDAAISPKNLQLAINAILGRHPQLDSGSVLVLANGAGSEIKTKKAFAVWLAALLALVDQLATG